MPLSAYATALPPRPLPAPLGALLRVDEGAADLRRRGVAPAAPERLETLRLIGVAFVRGCNAMLEAAPLAALAAQLDEQPAARHGFAVEGAAMGAAIRDALTWRGTHLGHLRATHGGRFDYLLHVGAGWALARLPWRAWALDRVLDPLLLSLVHDGRGFHDLYFRPGTARRLARPPRPGPWRAAYDQGRGRALWFIGGADVGRAIDLVRAAHPARRADLLAGLGLAMAYAGPAGPADWAALRGAFPAERSHLAQGVVFAAEAHRAAGIAPPNLATATRSLIGLDADEAAAIARANRPNGVRTAATGRHAYAEWRAAIRTQVGADAEERP